MDTSSTAKYTLFSSLVVAIISGLTEYILTDGLSTWIPLAAGIIGALIGGSICVLIVPRKKRPNARKSAIEDIVSGNLTSIEANRLVKPYIGSTIEVSGTVLNVSAIQGVFFWFLERHLIVIDIGHGRKIFAVFRWFFTSSVRRFRVGDKVSVYGTIEEIREAALDLASCHIKK